MATEIVQGLLSVQERIIAACQRAGRDPAQVRLVTVSKTIPLDMVQEGIRAGVSILGENYIQEAQSKIEALGRAVEWHFIGRLQTNKAKFAVKLFDLIHSVGGLKLARELDKRAGAIDRCQAVLVQVNISGEESKGGIESEETAGLVAQIKEMPNLKVQGLMTMPPFFDQPERARPYFAALRELRDKIGPPLTELSMGMSGDFEVAIEEGATLIRVGTAIFGPRS